MSEMSTLQRTVASFAWSGIEAPDHAKLIDLVSEAGELSKEMLKGTNYKRASLRPPDGGAGEMGDVLFALVCLAHDTGVDLEVALNKALDKYNQRLALESDAAASEG